MQRLCVLVARVCAGSSDLVSVRTGVGGVISSPGTCDQPRSQS